MRFDNEVQLYQDLITASEQELINLKNHLHKMHPTSKLGNFDKAVKAYFTTCVEYVKSNAPNLGTDFSAPIADFGETTGVIAKQNIFRTCQNYMGFFTILVEGSNVPNPLNSSVRIKKVYKDILKNYISTKLAPLNVLGPMPRNLYGIKEVDMEVPVDIVLLRTILNRNWYVRADNKHVTLTQSQRSNIEKIIHNTDVNLMYKQSFAHKHFNTKGERCGSGRLYSDRTYNSTTLQQMSSDIRNVVTPHLSVDIDTACFSVFLQINEHLNLTRKVPKQFNHIKNYIDNKTELRNNTAINIHNMYVTNQNEKYPHKEQQATIIDANGTLALKQIKAAFTAIGFGAATKGTDAMWFDGGRMRRKALSDILNKKINYFTNMEWIADFISEVEEIRKDVLELYSGKGEIYPGVILDKQRPATKLALIYQSLERQLLDIMYSAVGPHNVYTLLHDGMMVNMDAKMKYYNASLRSKINEAITAQFELRLPNGDTIDLSGLHQHIKVSVEEVDLANINRDYVVNSNPIDLDEEDEQFGYVR